MSVYVLDIESEGINFDRPHLQPFPVGLGVRYPDGERAYLPWGHTRGGNETGAWEKACKVLQRITRNGDTIVGHNITGFDIPVMVEHMGFEWPTPDRIIDTKILAFLAMPDAQKNELSLKPLGEKILGRPPTQQAILRDHILTCVPEATKKNWGGYIFRGHADIVGAYCIEDIDLPWMLYHNHFALLDLDQAAIERENEAVRVAHAMTVAGYRTKTLKGALDLTRSTRLKLNRRIHRKLGDVGLDSPKQLGPVLMRYFGAKEDEWPRTAKGALSTSWKTIGQLYEDPILEDLHAYKQAKTIHDNLVAWTERGALATDKRVHVQWNTTAGSDGQGRTFGARTGRLSASHTQNVAKEPEPLIGLPLPNLREHVCAAPHHKLIVADYAAQEPRLTAHFAGGALAQAYRDNPQLDPHTHVAKLMGVSRPQGKALNLGLTYGQGIALLALKLGVEYDRARELKDAFLDSLPEVRTLDANLRKLWIRRKPITTWGGRDYHCETAALDDDGEVIRSFEYKAVNTLIQGSAADQLKQAMIDYHNHPDRRGWLIMTVHDEMVVEVPKEFAKAEALVVKEAMEGVGPFDVPFLAEVGIGTTWSAAK